METMEERIAWWEQVGSLDPQCSFCRREFYDKTPRPDHLPFMPHHKASDRCESGKRPHCTCDTCF